MISIKLVRLPADPITSSALPPTFNRSIVRVLLKVVIPALDMLTSKYRLPFSPGARSILSGIKFVAPARPLSIVGLGRGSPPDCDSRLALISLLIIPFVPPFRDGGAGFPVEISRHASPELSPVKSVQITPNPELPESSTPKEVVSGKPLTTLPELSIIL